MGVLCLFGRVWMEHILNNLWNRLFPSLLQQPTSRKLKQGFILQSLSFGLHCQHGLFILPTSRCSAFISPPDAAQQMKRFNPQMCVSTCVIGSRKSRYGTKSFKILPIRWECGGENDMMEMFSYCSHFCHACTQKAVFKNVNNKLKESKTLCFFSVLFLSLTQI